MVIRDGRYAGVIRETGTDRTNEKNCGSKLDIPLVQIVRYRSLECGVMEERHVSVAVSEIQID